MAREIAAYGFEFFDLEDVEGITAFLSRPDLDLLERNLGIARVHFNLADLPVRLAELLGESGIA